MARLVVSAVVGVAAYAATGFTMPMVGFQAAALTYGVTGFLDPTKKLLGPKLNDLKAPGASYGEPIAYIEGAPREAGKIIWASDKRPIANTTSQGGKGGPGVDSTTFTYEMDIMVLLSINGAAAVRRVFSNGKLVWSNGDDADDETLAASAATNSWRDIRFYDGGPTQMPDPTYEAAVGVGNAPAYRTRSTIVIEGLNLGGSGQMPVLTFEVLSEASTSTVVNTFTHVAQDRFYTGGIPAMALSGFDLIVGDYTGGNALVYAVAADGTDSLIFETSIGVAFQTAAGNSDRSILVYNPDNSTSFYFGIFADGSSIPFNGSALQDPLTGGPGAGALFSMKSGKVIMSGGAAWNNKIARFDGVTGGEALVSATVPSAPASHTIAGNSAFVLSADNTTVYEYDLTTLASIGSFHSPVTGGSGAALFADSSGLLYFMVASGSPYPSGAAFGDGRAWTWSGSAWTLAATALGEVAVNTVSHNSAAFSVDSAGNILAQHWDGLPANEVKVSRVLNQTAIVLPTLDQVVRRLCLRTKLLTDADIDVTDLSHDVAIATGLVRGMAISQVSTTRDALETLAAAYLFECVENSKLVFVRRGGSSVATIPYADLGAGENPTGEPLPLKRANDIEAAARVSVRYANTKNDYQDGLEAADRLVTDSTSEQVVEFALGFEPAEAKKLADANTMDLATRLIELGPVTLTRKYARLEPTDVVTLVGPLGEEYRARITKLTLGNGTMAADLVLDDSTVITSGAVTDGTYTSSTTIRLLSDTQVELLDIPILRDADNSPGIYAVFTAGTSWLGAELDRSPDDITYGKLIDTSSTGIVGVANTTLGDYTGVGFDEVNSLEVNVGDGTLASSTRDVLLTGVTNALLVGSEVLQFRTATLVSPGVYTLTGFLRGRRGTEWAMPGHVADERVVVLTTAGLRRVSEESTDIGQTFYYKAVTAGQSQADAASQSFVDTGIALKPFSPTDLRYDYVTGTLTWNRRSRLSSVLLGTTAPPLGETSESYDVELRDGSSTLVETDTVSSAEWSATGLATVGNLIAPIAAMKTLGTTRVGIRVDLPGQVSFATNERLLAFTSGGAIDEQTPVIGIISQWCAASSTVLYAVAYTLTNSSPQVYLDSKVYKFTLGSLPSATASATAATAGDWLGVAFDGSNPWVTEHDSGNLRKLDASTIASVASYAISGGPTALLYASGKLWVILDTTREVARWDIASHTEDFRFSVATEVVHPLDIVLSATNVYVYGTGGIGVYSLSAGVLVASHSQLPVIGQIGRTGTIDGSGDIVAAVSTPTLAVLTLSGTTGAQVDQIASPKFYLPFVAGVDGTGMYLTGSDGPGFSYQTLIYAAAPPGLVGYTFTVYQKSATVGRGYPASLTI